MIATIFVTLGFLYLSSHAIDRIVNILVGRHIDRALGHPLVRRRDEAVASYEKHVERAIDMGIITSIPRPRDPSDREVPR